MAPRVPHKCKSVPKTINEFGISEIARELESIRDKLFQLHLVHEISTRLFVEYKQTTEKEVTTLQMNLAKLP